MLVQLSIRDIVLIERLDIAFENDLSVLTGETGAGKSILLDALSLALGARGDGSLVRSGQSMGQVTAVFDLPSGHIVSKLLDEHAIDFDGNLLLKRVQSSDGRSKAFVNDQPISVSLLRQIGMGLIELHGQHDERALLEDGMHRHLLDEFGGLAWRVDQVSAKWKAWQAVKRQVIALEKQVKEAQREADYLKASVAELELLAPQPGEETELAERRQKMMKAEKIAVDLQDAEKTLSGDSSPIAVLSYLAKLLERKNREVPGILDEAVAQLDVSLDALHLVHQEIEVALRESEFDPRELELSEERLFALRAASRKYSVAVEALPDLAVRLADNLDSLVSGEEKLQKLNGQLLVLKNEFFAEAEVLSKERKIAGDQLSKDVMKELPPLKLESAEFIVMQRSAEEFANSEGIDQIEFWVRTNPGTKAGPIVKIASGGELSRFLLALKVALADKGSAPTLVFDEIDTGVGGAVADAIGKRLKKLAAKVQVLSVTHAPQVAARAANHFVISKRPIAGDPDGRVATGVISIVGQDRREEIARMLAGASITDEARAAAEQLINQTAA